MSSPAFRRFMKNWYDPAALPIFVVVGGASVGAGWYLTRLARGPDVVWDRRGNPEPWNSVKENQTTKLYHVNHQGQQPWHREKW